MNKKLATLYKEKVSTEISPELEKALDTLETIQPYISKAYDAASILGHWDEDKGNTLPQVMMLTFCEAAELVEIDRKALKPSVTPAFFDGLSGNYIENYEKYIKGTPSEEFADIAIRLLSLGGKIGMQSWQVPLNPVEEDFMKRARLSEQMYGFIYHICVMFHLYKEKDDLGTLISGFLTELCYIANIHNVDLRWNIDKKLAYNITKGASKEKAY